MSEEYIEPLVEFTRKELLLVLVMIAFIVIEFKYMYTWCKWFTNC